MLRFMVIVTALAERDRWVANAIGACISFANSIFQSHIISLCFFPSPLGIVPTSGVGWASLFLMSNHFSLIPSHHRRWWAWQIDPKLVGHHLDSQFASKCELWFCCFFPRTGSRVDCIDFCNQKEKCKLTCGPPFSTPNILQSNRIMTAIVHIINPMFSTIVT